MSYNISSATFLETVHQIILDTGDIRVQNWFLMQSPMTVCLIVASYLYFCNSWGPNFMKNRKPFELKKTILVYNAVNVGLSVWLVHECLTAGWWRDYNLKCQPIDKVSIKGYRMARMCWVYFLCKIFELLDTVFFVLRKKYNQVTFLHLYHHSIMPICVWLAVKWAPGGHMTSGFLMNSFIHVIMYSYYLVSALGPQFQKYLWWKKYLTAMQLIQFLMMVGHQSLVLVFECDFPKFIPCLQLAQAAFFFYLFGTFYIRSYRTSKNRKSTSTIGLDSNSENNISKEFKTKNRRTVNSDMRLLNKG